MLSQGWKKMLEEGIVQALERLGSEPATPLGLSGATDAR